MNKVIVLAALLLAGVAVVKAQNSGQGEIGRYGVACWGDGAGRCVTIDTATGDQVGEQWDVKTNGVFGTVAKQWHK